MERALERELKDVVSWPEPKGGFFLWLTLPTPIDAEAMIPRAVEHGVIYVAGEAFFVDAGSPTASGPRSNTMRLSFSAPTPQRIEEGVARLAATVRGELEAVTSRGPAAFPATR